MALLLLLVKLGADLAVLRAVTKRPLTPSHVVALAAKDFSLFGMLVYGFFASTIDWRGNRRRVLAGTVLA